MVLYLSGWVHVLYGSNRFGRVEPPQTDEKLSYDPCSLWSSLPKAPEVRQSHSGTSGTMCRLYTQTTAQYVNLSCRMNRILMLTQQVEGMCEVATTFTVNKPKPQSLPFIWYQMRDTFKQPVVISRIEIMSYEVEIHTELVRCFV